MISSLISTFALHLFLAVIVGSASGAPRKKKGPARKKGPPPINVYAEKVSKAIPKFDKNKTKQNAEEEMAQLLTLLTSSNRDNLSSTASLLRTAMDFREDIGEHQKTISMGAIMKAWDTAFTYGAIGPDNHNFYGLATKGRYVDEELVFENIVPADVLPECTGYIGNLRLVPTSLARKPDEAPDENDKAYAIGLKQVMHEKKSLATLKEIQKSKVGHLAMSPAEHEARWRTAVIESGDAFKQTPNLQLQGQKMGTPSKLNGQRYKLRIEVTNLSRHPTEVEIVSTIVGYTENLNKLYEMRRDQRTLKLRRSQVDEFFLGTPNIAVFKAPLRKFDPKRSQRVMYRGFTLVAKFNGEVIASTGSDARLMKVASGEYPAPTMIAKASRLGGKPPAPTYSYDLMRFTSAADLASGNNGEIVSAGPSDTIGLMADDTRMYRLDTDGILWIYETHSFDADAEPLGNVFAGADVHSLFSDGTSYYIHLSQSAETYAGNDVVQFSSVGDLISGYNGIVVGQAAPGSAAFMADGKTFFKFHHGDVQQALLSSESIDHLVPNTESHYQTLGKLFCATNHLDAFSDGTFYYIVVPTSPTK